MVVSHLTGVLGPKLEASAKAVGALNSELSLQPQLLCSGRIVFRFIRRDSRARAVIESLPL